MRRQAVFNAAHLPILDESLNVAEECVGDLFALSETSWRAYPYEVRTLADLSPREVTDRALAQVVRLRQDQRPGRIRSWDFFRICLQDHNLLGVIEREGEQSLMFPLLTYVLTHELIHIIRFYRFEHLFEAHEAERIEEEKIVHDLTAQALKKAGLETFLPVTRLYEHHYAGVFQQPRPEYMDSWEVLRNANL